MRPFPKGEQYPGFFERPNTGPARLRIRDNRDVRPPREAWEHLKPVDCRPGTRRIVPVHPLANALERLQMNGW
jgi:hypothetical protein